MGHDPSLREPDVWTGTANADASEPLMTKCAETHRGLRQRCIGPLQKAGYTSAIVTLDPDQPSRCNQAGSIYIHTRSEHDGERAKRRAFASLTPLRQHPPHVGMASELHRRRVRVAALRPIGCEVFGGLGGQRRQAETR